MFKFAQPLALMFLLVPLLIWFLFPAVKERFFIALKVPFYDDFVQNLAKNQIAYKFQNNIFYWLWIWIFLTIALAGPIWVGNPAPSYNEGYNIFLALDISGSMEIPDMLTNGRANTRLDVVKEAAKQFVQARNNDRIGLVLFGTNAYLQTPLTFDHENVLQRLNDATVGLAGQTTSIGDAIGLSIKKLESTSKSKIIILLTDGVNNSGILSPIKAAELAKAANIKIYTIGLGGEIQLPMRGMFFNNSMDLDEETLKNVAKITGGRYFKATDPKSLKAIYERINQLETTKTDERQIRPQKDFFVWPAMLALLMIIFWIVKPILFRSKLI